MVMMILHEHGRFLEVHGDHGRFLVFFLEGQHPAFMSRRAWYCRVVLDYPRRIMHVE